VRETLQIADDFWAFRLAHRHWLNLEIGDPAVIGMWNDYSDEGVHALDSGARAFVTAAEATEVVSASDQVLLETVAATAFMDAAETTWWAELEAPNLQVGLLSAMLPGLALQPLVTTEHGQIYLSKLRGFPMMIGQIIGRLEIGATTGVVPVGLHVQQSIDRLDQWLASPLDADPLMSQLPPTELDEDARAAWVAELRSAVSEVIRPALEQFRATLAETTLPASRSINEPGLCHLPGGDAVYRDAVKGHTTLDLTPEQIHQIGLNEVSRIEREYVRLASPLLGTSELSEIYHRLRTDPELHYDDADEIVADSLRCLEKATAAMGDWFDPLPKAACIATATDVGAMAFYRAPSQDSSQPGEFFFNIADPSAWAKFQVPAIAYHEGVPGHHLQFALAMENEGIHPVHGLNYIAAYGEGWGLYTESLSDEMGLYEDDWERVGMLMADSMRAGRLVVDTGMHALGWTRQQAIDFFADHSPMAMYEIREEIDRYIASPGQALSCMLGRLEIQTIRADAESALGDRFDIKEFHNVVLGTGTVPLPTLRRMVEAWVAVEGLGPGAATDAASGDACGPTSSVGV
jgi:uncharacterized protein (DUF885 family)